MMKNNWILGLIREKCRAEGISQKRLCAGVCDAAYISRCINKNIEPDKLMLDILMQRLGISVRSYRFILRESEYAYFTMREKIRMCLLEQKTGEAKQLIQQYIEMQTGMKGAKKLHHQMALLLRSYLLKQENADVFMQMQTIDEAIACTIPEFSNVKLEELLLGEVELLLLFRKAMLFSEMKQEEEAYAIYQSLYCMQNTHPYTSGEQTYIFAAADYHLAKIYLERKEYDLAEKVAECGWMYLSKNNKFHFLAELLEIISFIRQQENVSFLKTFIQKYEPDWDADTHYPLYREFSVYAFRNMVVQRRKMLGLTQEGLSEKCCCDMATIERMEQGVTEPQCDIAYHILNTVGLPSEKAFYLLQTDSYYVKENYMYSIQKINANQYKEIKENLQKIRDSIDMSLVINQQAIAFEECVIHQKEQDSSIETKIEELMQILNLTIPAKAIGKDAVIVYGKELQLIRNIAMYSEKLGKAEEGIALLHWAGNGFLKENSIGEENAANYLSVFKLLESMYANKGDFKTANEILESCIPFAIRLDITGMLVWLIYDKAWNMLAETGTMTEECYSEFRAAYEIAKFYKDKRVFRLMKIIIDSFVGV